MRTSLFRPIGKSGRKKRGRFALEKLYCRRLQCLFRIFSIVSLILVLFPSRSRKFTTRPFRSSRRRKPLVWKKKIVFDVAGRLEGGSEDGSSTHTEEDVLAQGGGAVGGSRGGLASGGDAGAVGGRSVTAGLGHGGGSEDGDESSSTHFDGFGGLGFCGLV